MAGGKGIHTFIPKHFCTSRDPLYVFFVARKLKRWNEPFIDLVGIRTTLVKTTLLLKAAVNTVRILSKSCMFFGVFRFAENTNFLHKGGIRFFLCGYSWWFNFVLAPFPVQQTVKQQHISEGCSEGLGAF